MAFYQSVIFPAHIDGSAARVLEDLEGFAMGVWWPLVSYLLAACVLDDAPFLIDKPLADLNLKRWVDESRRWAEQLTDVQRAGEAEVLADAYVRLEQFRTAFAMVSGLNDPAAEVNAIIILCGSLASYGHVVLAERLAETLPDGETVGPKGESLSSFPDSPRTRALRLIAIFQMIRGDPEGAFSTTRKIADERARASVLLRLARSGARTGHYDAAEKALRMASELWRGDPVELARVQELIAECRREGRSEAPKSGFLNSLRGAVFAFSEGTAQRGKGQELPNAFEKQNAVPSLQNAWKRLESGDPVGSRIAAEEYLGFVDSGSESLPFFRAVDYCLLADLFLELGEKQKAQSLAAKALSALKEGLPLDRGLASFTILPLVVSVYARTGSLQEALDLIENVETSLSSKHEGDLPLTGEAWLALGVGCALAGETGFIERLLQENRPVRQKALLSLGVAIGLQERKHQ